MRAMGLERSQDRGLTARCLLNEVNRGIRMHGKEASIPNTDEKHSVRFISMLYGRTLVTHGAF